jgi:hypothetical protein
VEKQVILQTYLDKIQCGQSAGYRGLLEYKSEFDKILLGRSFSDVSNYVMFTTETPTVMTSFGIMVQFDFQGNRLQDLSNIEQPLDSIYTSIIATETGGAIVLVWRDVHTHACTQFVQSLAALPDRDIPNAIIRLVFEHSENTFFNPSWWNAMPNHFQLALINRITNAADFSMPRKPDCLLPDGNHYADWVIARRQSNRQV